MFDQDELDAWLWEVETTSKKVKDILSGKIDIKKLDEEERIKKEKKEKEQATKIFREEEKNRLAQEKIQKGNKGHGGGKNIYEKFCKFCFIEYEIKEYTNCYYCKKELITKEQRLIDLKGKVEVLKLHNATKKFRRAKYENWVKTEQIVKTRTFRNYEKWELYESSSDEEEKKEPILPRNDPSFLALEKDMIETQKARQASRDKAVVLKDEGNQAMKDGKFRKAIKLYGEALEECRGMMVLYTNRALAYIRVDEYDNALKDCDKVIEYMEIFEEELKNNKGIYIKAQCRKAQSAMKLKDFQTAIECINIAKNLSAEDEILKLHKTILLEHDIYKKSLEIFDCDSENYINVDKLFDNLRDSVASNSDYFKTNYIDNKSEFNRITQTLKNEENLKLYFIKKGGLELIFSFIKKFPDLLQFLDIFSLEEKFIIQINNIKGYNKLVNILFLDSENSQNFNLTHFKLIVGILEDSSQIEVVRKTLSQMKNFDKLFMLSFTKFDISIKETTDNKDNILILMHFFTFICNICYSSPEIRGKIAKNFTVIMEKIHLFIKNFKLENVQNKNLLETILSFLTNMTCEAEFRLLMGKDLIFLSFLIDQMNAISMLCEVTEELEVLDLKELKTKNFGFFYFENFKEYEDLFEKILCLLYNTSFRDELNLFYIQKKISEPIKFFIRKVFSVFYEKKNLNYFSKEKKTYFSVFNEITLLRNLMFLAKITKINQNYSDLQISEIFETYVNGQEKYEKSFYIIIFEMLNTENYKKNPKIVDNLIK